MSKTTWAIIIVIILLVGGYFLYTVPSSNPTDGEGNIQDAPSSSRSYTNQKYFYNIMYPESWLTVSCGDELFVLGPTQDSLITCGTEALPVIAVEVSAKNASELQANIDGFSGGAASLKKEDVSVAGQQAVKFSGTYLEGYYSEVILFIKGEDLYRLYYNEWENEDEGREVFDMVASSLTFTN